ncbi:interleukin-20 receptor subunit alpha-like [Mantella aurantiaca]
MLLPLLMLLNLPPVLSAKPRCNFKGTASFSSRNFYNNLTWRPPENSKGFWYTVLYKEYGTEHWQEKIECTNISLTWCDLTNETNKTTGYFGKVIIQNETCAKSVKTKRFYPLSETIIDPPTINLIPGDASIEIKLTHPIKSLNDTFKGVEYYIYLNSKVVKQTEEPYFKIENLDPNTTYCITAEIHWLNKIKTNLSNKICITTNSDRTSQQTIDGMIYILPVTLIFCTVTLLLFITYKYIHGSNLKPPKTLDITSSNNNNNAILVNAHTVTVNVITIEFGKLKLQETMMSGQEDKEFQNQTGLLITDGKDHSRDPGVTEESNEESDDGYVSLQEQIKTAKPVLSPYDMPHHINEAVISLYTSTDGACEEKKLYGHINSIAKVSPVQKNDNRDVVPVEYTSEKTIVNNLYVPHRDFPNIDKLKEDLCELQESIMDQELDRVNVIEDRNLNESLFIDWSSEDPPIHISSLSKRRELENCIKQCQEEKESLLSCLYISPELNKTTNENELVQLEERWGLLIQNAEKLVL